MTGILQIWIHLHFFEQVGHFVVSVQVWIAEPVPDVVVPVVAAALAFEAFAEVAVPAAVAVVVALEPHNYVAGAVVVEPVAVVEPAQVSVAFPGGLHVQAEWLRCLHFRGQFCQVLLDFGPDRYSFA